MAGAHLLPTARDLAQVGLVRTFASGLADAFSKIDFLFNRTPSPQQLSFFWAGDDVGAAYATALQTPIRTDLYTELRTRGDYPERLIRRVAVANGNPNGRWQSYGTAPNNANAPRIPRGAFLFEVNASATTWYGNSRQSVGMAAWVPQGAYQMGPVFRLLYLDCWWACDQNDLHVIATSQVRLPSALDVVPGAYQGQYAALPERRDFRLSDKPIWAEFARLLGVLNAEVRFERYVDRYTFIPTMSALDYDAAATPDRNALLNTTFASQNYEGPILRTTEADKARTPFDDVFAAGDAAGGVSDAAYAENQEHLMLTPGIRAFVLQQFAYTTIPNRIRPLRATISGPSHLATHTTQGTWYANAADGKAPYTYRWEFSVPCIGGGGELRKGGTANRENCGVWSSAGSTTSSLTRYFSGPVDLRVVVTDSRSQQVMPQMYISVGGNGGGALAAMDGLGVEVSAAAPPDTLTVRTPAPNPATSRTLVRVGLPEAADVRVEAFDLLGRRVYEALLGRRDAGWHGVSVDVSTWPSGVYVVRVQAGNQAHTHRLVRR